MSHPAPANQSRRPFSVSSLLLLALSIILLTIALQTWWTIAEDKRLVLEAEKLNGLVTVRLLEEHATQTFDAATRKLNEVADAIRKKKLNLDQHPQAVRQLLATYDLYGNPNLKALQYVDLSGHSWIISPDYPAHQSNISDRPYIKTLITHPEIEQPLIGQPYPSRYDSQLALPVARNLFDAQGRHLGLISVDIRLAYFSQLYARVAKENNASVAILSEDGFIIVRSPFEARFSGRDISQEIGLAKIRHNSAEGAFADPAFLDDEFTRLYTYRKLRGVPVATVYGRDMASILQPWELRRIEHLRFSGAIGLLVLALFWFLWRYVRNLENSRRSLHASELRFIRLFQLSPVPLALIRQHDRQVLEVNDAWSIQYGLPTEQVIGRSVDEIGIWADPEEHRAISRTLEATGRLERAEVHLKHSDGRSMICLLSARILEINGEKQIIFNSYDITRIREIESEILQLNIELEARVSQRTESLASANQELTVALTSLKTMQDELIRSEKLAGLGALVAGVAHELNTPIGNSLVVASTMQNSTEAFGLEVGKGHLQRSALTRYLNDMSHGSDIMVRTMTRAAELIQSFKQVAVDQTSNTRRRFNLGLVLGELFKTLEPTYKTTACTLTADIPADIEMDSFPGPLGQVITNLVSNSLAHAFEGCATGSMSLSASYDDQDWITLVYRDDGNGIPGELQSKVFDPFFTTKLGKGGSGLGLHIVYNIVTQVLGGSISLNGTLRSGVEFTLRIPRQAPTKNASGNRLHAQETP